MEGMKIYVYDLPSQLISQAPGKHVPGHQHHDPNYIAYQIFESRLLRDAETITEDPYEADLFYILANT
jgi:hypothetical protein